MTYLLGEQLSDTTIDGEVRITTNGSNKCHCSQLLKKLERWLKDDQH